MYFHVVVIFEYFIYGTLCAYKLYKLLQLKNAKDVFSGMASKYVFYFAIDQGNFVGIISLPTLDRQEKGQTNVRTLRTLFSESC